jgi:hypothetical protein
MEKNCTGANLKYITTDVCNKMCNKFDRGADGDIAGDSRTCRLHYAQAATSDPVTNCEAAGPVGDGPCTSLADGGSRRCEAFCVLDVNYCGGDDAGHPGAYADEPTCEKICNGEAGTPAYAYTPHTRVSSDENQNTLNCRVYHLEAAYVDDEARVTHCPHTQLTSITCQ